MTPSIVQSIQSSLGNYTIDQRGDVGSWVRLAAIDAVAAAARHGVLGSITGRDELLAGVCRLAAEKLDKVRIRAWGCLQLIWSRDQVATA